MNIEKKTARRNLGASSAALWDCREEIQRRRRDRTGEIVDEVVHGEQPPAVAPEMRAARYYRARVRADRIIPRLTDTELDALEDAIRAERQRRRGER